MTNRTCKACLTREIETLQEQVKGLVATLAEQPKLNLEPEYQLLCEQLQGAINQARSLPQ